MPFPVKGGSFSEMKVYSSRCHGDMPPININS
uniref:Uncharacterized protein n=1 Tax=Siphoviridae sp. ct1Eo1 TaxID=2825307 RepID=A0A8S5P4X0_9CAUD|nr:MAG TPA: hypothetical protein [Siphoviridae sp. ct1Eo1]